MMAKPMKTLELHHPTIQFLIKEIIQDILQIRSNMSWNLFK